MTAISERRRCPRVERGFPATSIVDRYMKAGWSSPVAVGKALALPGAGRRSGPAFRITPLVSRSCEALAVPYELRT
jgi:hypothetical protein